MSDVIRKLKGVPKVDLKEMDSKAAQYQFLAARQNKGKQQTSFLRKAGTPIHYTDGTSEPAPGPNR